MTGGPLGDDVYKLEQFHFHFGCVKEQGSEDTINGDSYSGEVRVKVALKTAAVSRFYHRETPGLNA